MVRKSLALHKLILATALTFVGSSSFGQVNLDLTTASVQLGPQSTINISNIAYGNSKYDATLQWNPVAGRFDITTASQASNTPKKCSLGKIYGSSYIFSGATDITITTDPASKTITIAYTPYADFSSSGGLARSIDKLWNLSLIQQGTQLYSTTDATNLSTNTVLYTQSADPKTGATVDWFNVPSGTTRYATLTKIPSWFNFNLPITSAYDSVHGASILCQ